MATTSKLIRGYEVVIGIETHVQLSTKSKAFSGSSTQFGAAPNTQASPVDLALPGTLPVMNKGAVERAIRFGLAVGAKVAPQSIFARKNYFYPDLPKGYQISQYEIPVVQGGGVEFYVGDTQHKVNLTRAHLEEDAGKSLHEDYAGQTGIDLNRAGTPLLEIVTEPDIRSSVEAVEYAKALHALVVWLDICDGNMQEGSFRCDANVSVRKPGADFGTRREIKNLNSFKFMQQAIDFEIQWQIDLIEDGGEVQQATVLFNPDTGETRAMRTKEDAHDYRYFPDPDLPPLVIAPEWVERVKAEMPELPRVMATRFVLHGVTPYAAAQLTSERSFADFFESSCINSADTEFSIEDWRNSDLVRLCANLMIGDVARKLNEGGPRWQFWISPESLGRIAMRIHKGVISLKAGKDLVDELWTEGWRDQKQEPPSTVDQLIERYGLKQVSDTGEIERILDEVLAANAKSVEEFRAGKEKAFNALVGQAMKATKGKANPSVVNELLKKKLAG
ncbi:MAG: Asp-tRNA(Asn)/Glu-tRNA(Gln) amidotransferase subunit GatB [Rhizobacter sp.]|nr:Asp-tRNA(Asn)/Glu-tRNA(Gln) amidotransferase subunit GatB [Rhizobacter sp.]